MRFGTSIEVHVERTHPWFSALAEMANAGEDGIRVSVMMAGTVQLFTMDCAVVTTAGDMDVRCIPVCAPASISELVEDVLWRAPVDTCP